MAQDEATTSDAAVAVAERPETDARAGQPIARVVEAREEAQGSEGKTSRVRGRVRDAVRQDRVRVGAARNEGAQGSRAPREGRARGREGRGESGEEGGAAAREVASRSRSSRRRWRQQAGADPADLPARCGRGGARHLALRPPRRRRRGRHPAGVPQPKTTLPPSRSPRGSPRRRSTASATPSTPAARHRAKPSPSRSDASRISPARSSRTLASARRSSLAECCLI